MFRALTEKWSRTPIGPFQDWAGEVVLAFCIRCYSPKNRYLSVADPNTGLESTLFCITRTPPTHTHSQTHKHTGRLRWRTLSDVHRWYFNQPMQNIFGDKLVLAHFDDAELVKYPPSLFICGGSDPLVFGAQRMFRRLTALGRESHLKIYPGHHAYLGFPVQWTAG
jgi:hypothetical protein